MTELRDSTKGDFRDILLVLFTSAGSVNRASMFTTGNIQKDLLLTGNALVVYQDMYLFSGQSIGYQTTQQKLIYTKDPKTGGLTTTTKTDLDAYIYRHIFDRNVATCVFTTDLKVNDVTRRITTYNGIAIEQEGFKTMTTEDGSVEKFRYSETDHVPYASRYSGGFALLDSLKIPRPCAFKSFNMTSVNYYRGQKALSYDISKNNQENYVTTLMGDPELLYTDG